MSEHPRFIVVFKDGVTEDQVQRYADDLSSGAVGGKVTNMYNSRILNGFAAQIPESYFQNLQKDDLIKYIERDSVVTTQ